MEAAIKKGDAGAVTRESTCDVTSRHYAHLALTSCGERAVESAIGGGSVVFVGAKTSSLICPTKCADLGSNQRDLVVAAVSTLGGGCKDSYGCHHRWHQVWTESVLLS